jgi:hypothetical protein
MPEPQQNGVLPSLNLGSVSQFGPVQCSHMESQQNPSGLSFPVLHGRSGIATRQGAETAKHERLLR